MRPKTIQGTRLVLIHQHPKKYDIIPSFKKLPLNMQTFSKPNWKILSLKKL